MRCLVALGMTALSACSLFTSLDGLGDGDPEPPADAAARAADAMRVDEGGHGEDEHDAGSADAGSVDARPVDASPADAGYDAALPNLHPNGSMEYACQGWHGYNATLQVDPTAHGGTGSCRVCATAPLQSFFSIDEEGAIPSPVVGGVYYAAGWFRLAPGTIPPPSGVKLFLLTIADSDSTEVESVKSAFVAMDETWRKIEVALPVTKSADRLRIFAGGTPDDGACFLVDDIRVERRQ